MTAISRRAFWMRVALAGTTACSLSILVGWAFFDRVQWSMALGLSLSVALSTALSLDHARRLKDLDEAWRARPEPTRRVR